MPVGLCLSADLLVQEKLEIMIQLANDRNIDQVLLEFKEYATEVDVDFVRKARATLPDQPLLLTRTQPRRLSADIQV